MDLRAYYRKVREVESQLEGENIVLGQRVDARKASREALCSPKRPAPWPRS